MMRWYELPSAIDIFGFLKLFDNMGRVDIILDICFAIHLIYVDQAIIHQFL